MEKSFKGFDEAVKERVNEATIALEGLISAEVCQNATKMRAQR